MQFLQKHPSKFTQVVMFGLLLFIACLQAMAQKPILPSVPTTCDYTTAPATITLTVGTEPSGFSKNYLLVNMVSGAIVATNSASPSFTNIPQGLYYATTAYYTSGAAIHNDIVGKLISDIYVDGLVGGCLKYATTVGIKVCTTTCDFNTAPAAIAFTATPSSTSGVSTTYALVDEASNKIIQTSTGASFTAVPVGDFSVVGVYYTGAFALAVGDTLYAKTTNDANCVGVSNTIHYKVCSVTCVAGTTAPAITPTTVSNTCPATTFSLSGLPNTGTKPAGTTLVWSTHKVPTSAGDTLTNLTTVSTAGKYYALYYDKVNNCYSPADSVDVTITNCTVPLAIVSPSAQIGLPNVLKTGSAPTDLVPTGGTGVLTYSNGSADPACIAPSGATALPVSSALTINPSTGAYSYTTPATAGTYYFCVKVCDSATPTANCKVGIYTVIVSTVIPPTPIVKNNICPKTTVNLLTQVNVTGTAPANAKVSWHSALPASALNQVADPTMVGAGLYYPVYKDTVNNCYGNEGTAIQAVITVCVPPIPTTIAKSNICPATSVNLLTQVVNSGIPPLNTKVTWHTGTTASALTEVPNPSAVLAGTYYPAYKDTVNNCYGGTGTGVVVTITVCTPVSCLLSLPVLLPLGLTLPVPFYCVTGNYNYYRDLPGSVANRLAVNPNGNTFNPSSIIVDASSTGVNSVTVGGNTAALAQRLNSIIAPGTFSVNGGVIVRIYYDPAEFTGLPANRSWFKHPAHTKAGVQADLTSTGLTNATLLTPSASGTENGYAYVEFNNITNFSTFGYIGTATAPLAIVQPSSQTGLPNTAKTGSAPTDLTPTGGTGALTYSNGSSDPACVAPSGATALPVSSNLTITASTGAYSYTTPTTPGTYYFCVKVCDSTTPTADCKVGVYTLTVTAPPCVAGTTAPTLTTTTKSNVCPATTANISSLVSSTCPTGSSLEWHTVNTGLSAANKVADATIVGGGTYYPVCFDATNTCYSPAPATGVTVTIINCLTTLTNTCPATTVDLMTKADSANKPAGTYVSWHTGTPATASNRVADPMVVGTSGTYYIAYFDPIGNCYGGTGTPITVTINVCPPPTPIAKSNICPATTVDLLTQVTLTTTPPTGTTLTWHSGTPATLANEISNPSAVVAGLYYPAYKDAVANCYSPTGTPIQVTINTCACLAGVDSPLLSANSKQNLCPATTADLSNITASNAPSGSTLTWHSATPANSANKINDVTALGGGTYYAAFYNAANNCYSGATNGSATTPVTVTIAVCPTTPPIQKQNICPASVVNLLTQVNVTTTPPSGTTVSWHTGTPATAANEVSSPDMVLAGIYYPAYKDAVQGCYSPTGTPIQVTINNCPALVKQNICPATTVNLLTQVTTTTPPVGTTVSWHTGTPATAANEVSSPNSVVGGIGVLYYPAFKDPVLNCYSPTGLPVQVQIITCPTAACTNTLTISTRTNPTTCGGNNGSFTIAGLDPSTAQTVNYKYNGGVTQVATLTSDNVGTVTVSNLGIGTYSNIQVVSPCISNVLNTALFGPTNCIPPIVTPKDSTKTICVALNLLAPPTSTASTCVGYPKVAGATASVSIANGQLCVTYVPKPGYVGTDTVCVRVCEPISGICTETKIPVMVSPAPLAINDINFTLVNTPVAGSVATNDTKVASTDTFTQVTNPVNGALVFNPDGSYLYVPNVNFVGKDSVQYKICTVTNVCSKAWLYLTVTKPSNTDNLPPIAQNDVAQTFKDKPVSGYLFGNDYDPEKGPLTATTTPVTPPTNGTVTINPNGTFTYTPALGFVGVDKFTYQVCDELNKCSNAVVTIYVTTDDNGIAVNDKPNAQDDGFQTYMNVPIVGNVKLNDSDPNGNSLIYSTLPVVPVAHGTLVLNTNGTFTYTPNNNFFGDDQFQYKVCDNGSPSKCDTATVYIVVTPPVPDAILDINVTAMNKPVTGNILTNDNGNGLPIILTTTPVVNPKHGTIVISPNGNYTYTPTLGFVGKDSVKYYICNSPMTCDTAWLTIKVTPLPIAGNNKPVANDDVAQTQKNIPVSGKVTNNDFDPDGNPLTVSVIVQPDNGTVVMNPDGTFTYTPDPNFTGLDDFKYVACDNKGLCDTATVVIRVVPDYNGIANDKPNAQDDANVTTQDIPVSASLKPNDSDPNIGQTLTYTTTPLSPPAHGTVTITAAGGYTYTPMLGYTGPDKFKYKVCDNGTPSLCDSATVYLLVNPPTVKPLAINDINITSQNTAVSGSVLTNDNTNGLSPVTTTAIVQPLHGTVSLLANGNYTYTPNTNFIGVDSLRYTLCKGTLCDTAWVFIKVIPTLPSSVDNNKPVANADVAITNINTPVSGAVANNDFDPDLTQTLSFTKTTNPAHGTVVMNPNGTYTYTPATGFVGTDIFMYKVCDSGTPVKCDSASVTIKVLPASGNTNDKPVANDDAFVTYQGIGINGNTAPNDTDPNGNTLAFSKITNPSNGTVTMNPNGTFSYAPNATFIGTDKFTYKICDNGSPVLCDTATVYLTVLPPKQPNATKPDAVNDIANTSKDTPVSGNVLLNDDGKGLPLTVSVPPTGNPVHGTIVMNPNGTYTYTPSPGYFGKDSVKYIACNNDLPAKCDTATLYLNVIDSPTAQNDKPVASNDVAQTPQGIPVNINVLNNDVDPDLTDILTPTKLTNPSNGTVVLNPNGTFTYTPNPTFIGKDIFTYKVCDNGNPVKCDTASVEIEVKKNVTPIGANNAPNAQDDALVLQVNNSATSSVAPNDTDLDAGQTKTFTALTTPSHGTVSLNATTGEYTYTPAFDYVGNDSFTYKLCDNGTPSLCDSATVYITVLPENKITKPLAINDINVTFIDKPVSGNVLTNDDGRGKPITSSSPLSIYASPNHGTITLQPNGNYTYTPAAGFVGKDSVQYLACNNLLPVECDTAWIYITVAPYPLPNVNNKPIATPDVAVTNKGVPVLGNVLSNDIDPDGNPLTVSVITNPSSGTLTLNPDGTFTYTPNPTFTGTDTFTYSICDNGTPSLCDTASVTIKVLPIDPTVSPTANKKPTAYDDLITTQEGKSVVGLASSNDSDPDAGQTLTFTGISNPTHGTVTMFPDGTFTYIPNPGFIGTDSFKYKVCDNGTPSLCDSATVIIKIDPSSTKPDAVDDINITSSGVPTTGNLLTNDDNKGLPLVVSELTPPVHGTVVINPITGIYTYTPTIGYVGKDSVQYKICNNQLPAECDSAWLFINVTPTPLIGFNNPPIASHDVNATDVNVPVAGNVSGNDKDPDAGQILTFTSLGNPPNGTVVLNPDGSYIYTPNAGFVGNDTFKYKVCDSGTPSLCDTASVTITVNTPTLPLSANKPPVANDDVVLGQEGKPVAINVGTNDNDPDAGQTLTFTKIGGNPNVSILPTGVLTYTPTLDPITGLPVGGNTVVYTACDNGSPSKCDTATVYLNITPSRTKPLAINDINVTPLNTSVTGDVLTNDDKGGLPVTATALTTALHGIFILNPNGTYSYLPNTNFVGKDSIQYQICNNLVPTECSKAWLYITVEALPTKANNKPVANPDAVQTLVNTTVSGTVLNNDFDPDGQPLTVSLISGTTHGLLILENFGAFEYTPEPGFVGKDTFKYRICDNGTPSLCDTATVTIDVLPKTTPNGANDAPFANDDAFVTTKNVVITASASPNDFEPNVGQTLAFTAISTPTNGTVVMNTDGTFTYTPANNYVGSDKFKYKVCDNGTPSLCDTATVYVTILPPPVATGTSPIAINDINITPINTLVTGNILTNDDKKGLPVTATVLIPATNGTFTLGVNGAYTYLPNNNYIGKDSIRYQICNSQIPNECDMAWVYITVIDAPNPSPTNPPIAMPDVNQTLVNKSVSGTVANNDSDPDAGQILSYTKLTNPTNGTVIFNGVTGAYTYTPNATFVGTDIFTYKVCDNGSPVQCASTNVTIKVTPDYSAGGNIKPIANDDAYSTGKGVGINGNASFNDYDPNSGQTLSYAAISVPTNGTVTMNSDGSFSYAPSATFVGTDKFLYKICDNGSPVLCDTATIYISVTTPKVLSCVTFSLKAILEGPYSTTSGKMSNFLNFSGLLPGQTPTRNTGVATPDGQPYKVAPWNYLGTEVMPTGGYPADVVDWVLVSLRADSLTSAPVFRAAGLLHDDGTITFVSPCFTVANGSYYILVEHRNHLGAMSHQKITITSGTITYDFTARESYVQTNPPSFGQKLKGTKYVMYTADSKKATVNDNYDINAADSNFWKSQSGIFDKYLFGDYNFDADVNNADNVLWKANNGRFSGVIH